MPNSKNFQNFFCGFADHHFGRRGEFARAQQQNAWKGRWQHGGSSNIVSVPVQLLAVGE
jgi:hypothetical protein